MRPNESGKMRKYENNSNAQNVSKNLNKERFAYVMTCLIGNEVTVHMKDGNEVKGLFHAYNCTSKSDRGDKNEKGGGGGEKKEKGEKQEKQEIDISLNYGRILPKNDKVSGPINKAMIIPENNYKAIIGKDIKLDLKDPDEVKVRKEKFKIDSDISERKKNSNNVNRELKRWICDEEDKYDENKLKLEKTVEPWDQFEQNRLLYGVTTTYKEEIYTTNLDINKVPHHVKIYADKIAKELEKRGMHLDPEDAEKDNKNLDEEDLFGAVRTSAKKKYNQNQKYKKEETKPKTYQGKFHPLVIKDLKEKIQSFKRENEKKYPNKQKQGICEPSSSSDDTNSTTNRKTKVPTNPKRIKQVSDFVGINALNLEPALPKLDDKTRSEWVMFKNKVKNKTVNKKDKNAEKLEFISAAKEFNEKLSGKMNLNKKEPLPRSLKEYPTTTQTITSNQKNASNDKAKHTASGSGDNKSTSNTAFTNPNSVNYNTSNMMMNNPNVRPHDFYMYNCNALNNIKNNMVSHNIDFYPNVPMIPESQNQVHHYGDNIMYKNEGVSSIYSPGGHIGGFKPNFPMNLPFFPQNMRMGEMLVGDLHSSQNASSAKDNSSNDELTPFPLKINENKTSFSDFVASVLNYSKGENCVECEIGFKSTYQFSYKNVLGEIPPCVPFNFMSVPHTGYSNSISSMVPPVPNNNISNTPLNYQLLPVMPPNVNNSNPYMENPIYFNPYFPNFYSNNNNNNTTDNNTNMNANNNVANNIPSVSSNNIPYMCNVPGPNLGSLGSSYSSNKNMNIYPLRTPLHPLPAAIHMNFPMSSYMFPNMNYPLNNNSMNMMNNPNMLNANVNISPYSPDMVYMNPQKFTNANLGIHQSQSQNQNPNQNQSPNPNHIQIQNQNQNQNPNPNQNPNQNQNQSQNPNQNQNQNQNINAPAPPAPQSIHPQFMTPYPYPNYYTPTHGVN